MMMMMMMDSCVERVICKNAHGLLKPVPELVNETCSSDMCINGTDLRQALRNMEGHSESGSARGKADLGRDVKNSVRGYQS